MVQKGRNTPTECCVSPPERCNNSGQPRYRERRSDGTVELMSSFQHRLITQLPLLVSPASSSIVKLNMIACDCYSILPQATAI